MKVKKFRLTKLARKLIIKENKKMLKELEIPETDFYTVPNRDAMMSFTIRYAKEFNANEIFLEPIKEKE